MVDLEETRTSASHLLSVGYIEIYAGSGLKVKERKKRKERR